MHKIKLFFIVALFASGLAACAAHSDTTGTINGDIMQHMDQQDKVNTRHALIATPVGQEAVWTNSSTKISYIVRPIKEYQNGQLSCRQAGISVNNGKQQSPITVCRGPDGKWYVKS